MPDIHSCIPECEQYDQTMEPTQYQRVIVCARLSREEIWDELRRVLRQLIEHGFEQVDVLFGFAWLSEEGIPHFNSMHMSVGSIEQRIRYEEGLENGKLGEDDIYLSHADPPFEILFCHEGDIHISYNEMMPFLEGTIATWKARQWRMSFGRKEGQLTEWSEGS